MTTDYPKADVSIRLIAFLIDLAVYVVIWVLLFFWLRLGNYLTGLAAGLYIVFRDGLFNGQSVGKKLMRQRVIRRDSEDACDFTHSVKRNIILYIPNLFRFINFFGGILGVVIVALELYFIFTNEKGLRWGDQFAETQVINET
ncbi:RDD family protein [bacterium BMS3Abin05]|nr:RDD family protein [bacterium BMS3Abin05]GBE28515.1 RDD family protein [bacterium BMS3Bbin03]HDK35433.1 hypothetical protein [Bacteroidota bacterium]HDL78178.1 hypothetical protein [Bacteroidota bacterium]HDZ12595.1 hypothetical protein [Bacteroidota bacterium]